MTIGIGVLASEGTGIKPDHVILLADTQGSFGNVYSMNRLHKLFTAPEKRLYAVGSGQIDRAAELIVVIRDLSNVIVGGTQRYGSTMETIVAGADLYKRIRFKYEVLPRFARIPQSLPDMFTDSELSPELLKAWQEYDFGCEMLVGTIEDAGQAFLFYIDGNGKVQNHTFPEFAAIGSGLDNAMFWLSYRNHTLSYSVKRSAYHAFEAKVMAESSPFVNESLDMLIASRDKWSFLSDVGNKSAGDPSPISLTELRQMFEQYGPKSTEGQ